MATEEDRNLWLRGENGQRYNSFLDALASVDAKLIRKAGVREFAPLQALTWCAFSDGEFLGHLRDPGWPGVIQGPHATANNVTRWIVDRAKSGAANANTPYSKYIDHLYDQLERRFEAVDIVFTDLVTLSDLRARRLIADFFDEDTLAAPLKDIGQARVGALGWLVTVNYHVIAAARDLKRTPPSAAGIGDVMPQRALVSGLLESPNVMPLLAFSETGKQAPPRTPLGSAEFAPTKTWLTSLRGPNHKDTYISISQFTRYWGLGAPNPTFWTEARNENATDARLFGLGMGSPIAPLQLAAGAHATYTTFAYFANCMDGVRSLLERPEFSDRHRSYHYSRVGIDKSVDLASLLSLIGGSDRQDRVLLMPAPRYLKTRGTHFFNFLWQFVPAASLCFDHVAAAFAREHFPNDWFDPCFPVEAVLFHSHDWHNGSELSEESAQIDGRPLSCLGEFSFAVTQRAFNARRAHEAVIELRRKFWEELDARRETNYHRLRPAPGEPSWTKSVSNSAVRPTLSFWGTVDEIISDAVKLYSSALFVARALNSHCFAVLGTRADLANGGWPKLNPKAVNTTFGQSLGGLPEPILTIARTEGLDPEILYREVKRFCTSTNIEQVLGAVEYYTTRGLGSHYSEIGPIVSANLSGLRSDSDYIFGILQTCDTLEDYSEHFVNTIVSKISSLASSKHWTVCHVN